MTTNKFSVDDFKRRASLLTNSGTSSGMVLILLLLFIIFIKATGSHFEFLQSVFLRTQEYYNDMALNLKDFLKTD